MHWGFLKHSHSPCQFSSLRRIPRKQPSFVYLFSHGRFSVLRFATSAAAQLIPAHPCNERAAQSVATPAVPNPTSDLRPDSAL
ncbi:hypothetical protein CgunFtcFv8_026618 [Champsocephalus gunnari]|uniref:Uncharacterized protein n=1 Tax=Champsocephalus gunnari TaxID=52237 RepID=A0AAN8HVY1_CHAGU|nr:hypothetical protein CgunFtcFv8_026618 [Champsocephalus gunnari]